jgi:hypothetical protein
MSSEMSKNPKEGEKGQDSGGKMNFAGSFFTI